MRKELQWKILQERNHFVDLIVDGRIIQYQETVRECGLNSSGSRSSECGSRKIELDKISDRQKGYQLSTSPELLFLLKLIYKSERGSWGQNAERRTGQEFSNHDDPPNLSVCIAALNNRVNNTVISQATLHSCKNAWSCISISHCFHGMVLI